MTVKEKALLLAVAKLLAELVAWKNIDSNKSYEIFKLIEKIDD